MTRTASIALPVSIASPDDLREVSDELHAHRRVAGSLSDAARDVLRGASCDSQDFAAVDQLVTTLRGLYDTAPRITVTLAALPDSRSKLRLTEWFRQNCSPTTLITFAFNRALLGGATVRAGSRIHDWSYRSKLLDSNVKFSEVLGRVR